MARLQASRQASRQLYSSDSDSDTAHPSPVSEDLDSESDDSPAPRARASRAASAANAASATRPTPAPEPELSPVPSRTTANTPVRVELPPVFLAAGGRPGAASVGAHHPEALGIDPLQAPTPAEASRGGPDFKHKLLLQTNRYLEERNGELQQQLNESLADGQLAASAAAAAGEEARREIAALRSQVQPLRNCLFTLGLQWQSRGQ